MKIQIPDEMPISLQDASKRDVRTQFAALCYRMVKGKPEILMVTTRRSGRWIIPKGWPMDGKTPVQSVLAEAWEEAGVVGKGFNRNLGLFSYQKLIEDGVEMPCVAVVYPVKVKSLLDKYPEKGQRKRKWMTPKRAAERVVEPDLARILRRFDPTVFKQ